MFWNLKKMVQNSLRSPKIVKKIWAPSAPKKKKRRKIQKGAAPKVKNDGPFLWTFFVDLLTSFFRNSFILLRFWIQCGTNKRIGYSLKNNSSEGEMVRGTPKGLYTGTVLKAVWVILFMDLIGSHEVQNWQNVK